MDVITSFYPGVTKTVRVVITLDGDAPDITGDTVTLRLKSSRSDADASAVLTKEADVLTAGATGTAIFSLTPSDTQDLTPGPYYYDIVWELAGGGEYVLNSSTVRVLDRVSDPV